MGNTYSNISCQEEGVSQGCVLSVTLFVLAIDPNLSVIPQTVQNNLYVDDLHISCYARNMQLIERQLQTAINNIIEWSNKSGFTISAQKTIGIHFCKRTLHPDPELFLSGAPIRFQDNYKFLGIVFDKRLTFLSHIASLRKRCLRSLNILRTLSNTSWGADRSCLLRVYRSIIRSMIDYGSVVYGSARPSYLKRLDYVHHQALRLCLGAFRTSPIPSLYAEVFEPSLSSRRDKLSLSYYFRILSNDNHPLRGTLLNGNNNHLFNARPSCIPHFGLRMRNILPDSFHDVKIHTNDFCAHPPWMENSISYINPFGNFTKSDSNNSVLISLFNQHRQFYQSYQPVFTDGSKSLNHVGCAFFTNGHIISYKLDFLTSIFSSEITAVYFALKYIDVHEIRKSILYTDSMSFLESLRSSSTRNPLIKEVKDFYRHLLSKGARILFSWVPSHVGITGNELADKSAKSATEFLTRPIVYADVRSAVNQWCHCQWQEKWNMETNNKLHVIKLVLSHWVTKLNRRCVVVLTRLRIGHTRLTHKYLLFAESPPTCSDCGDILTVKHILIDCVAVNRRPLRFLVFGVAYPIRGSCARESQINFNFPNICAEFTKIPVLENDDVVDALSDFSDSEMISDCSLEFIENSLPHNIKDDLNEMEANLASAITIYEKGRRPNRKFSSEDISLQALVNMDRLPEEASGASVIEVIHIVHLLLVILLRKVAFNLSPRYLIRFLFNQENPDKPISTHLMPVSEMTVERLLTRIVHVVVKGGYFTRRRIRHRDEYDVCCARAILLALARLGKRLDYAGLRRKGCSILLRKALSLHEKTGVMVGPCGVDVISMFEAYLNVQVIVFSTAEMNRVSYKGKKRDRRVYIWLNDGRYDVVTSPKECSKVIKRKVCPKERHRCGEKRCPSCTEMVANDHRCCLRRVEAKSCNEKLIFFDFEMYRSTNEHVVNFGVAHYLDGKEFVFPG
ncbi:hypothetical protein AVEN_24895-1 [Araneus ventricosus]|uniref:RNA-directed DNA polymerase from mobile element jockey n=1 Tax=Araneus ventricosus TaxID=182803 RepID=A0A4Y2QR76_ARAVE|nr:hypothetical protein AVEN_24895-1 [Araneus ventricosus]